MLPEASPNFSSAELLPVVVQDASTQEVLMLAWMNREAYDETLRTGQAVYFSRSRGRLWRKGEESGNVQHVRRVLVDCDRDTILLQVEQVGAACHEGYASCFYREVLPDGLKVIAERVFDPAEVYSSSHKESPT
jgi:phosphoribosyl-AMP cyclohydrolase